MCDDGRREALFEADLVDESLPRWMWKWVMFVGLLGSGLLFLGAGGVIVWAAVRILAAMWGGG